MFQRIHGVQKFNLKQQKEFGVFLQWSGDMKDNYMIPDGLYTGVITRRTWRYWENTFARTQLDGIEILFACGFKNEDENMLCSAYGKVEEEDYTDYRVGECVILEIENQKIKKWKLWRDSEYYNRDFEYYQ